MAKPRTLANTVSTGGPLEDGTIGIAEVTGLQTALDEKAAGTPATASVGGELKLYEATDNGTNYVSFKAPNTLAGNVTWVLPSVDGTNGQALVTNGSGTLSWGSASRWTLNGSDISYSAGNVIVGNANSLRLADSDSSHYVALKSPATVAANVTWTLPSADGTNGQMLVTNGAGVLSWTSTPVGGTNITAGDTNVTVSDTGTNGRVAFTVDGSNNINMYSYTSSSTGYMTINAGNSTAEPVAALYVNRGYTVHPGRTSDYYGIQSVINGPNQDTSNASAAIYGLANAQLASGVLGKAFGQTHDTYGVTGAASMSTDGYGFGYGLRSVLQQTATNPGNGTLVGLLIDMPNYARSGGASGQYAIWYRSAYTGSNTQYFAVIERNGVERGSITVTTSGTSYNTTSDYRLKENVRPLKGALADVARLNPVTFSWKETGEESIGFIAHELQAVVPQAVTGTKDGVTTQPKKDAEGNLVLDESGAPIIEEVPAYQGIDTSFLVATLTAAIQELKAELDSVKGELALLKNQ